MSCTPMLPTAIFQEFCSRTQRAIRTCPAPTRNLILRALRAYTHDTLKREKPQPEQLPISVHIAQNQNGIDKKFGVRVSCCSPLNAGIAQLVEHNLAKVGVAGSNPVSRSMHFSRPCGAFSVYRLYPGRRTQVAKGEVCKTFIQRFESARRLLFFLSGFPGSL